MTLPVLILGSGGHAKILIDALQSTGQQMLGLVDPKPERLGESVLGVRIIGDDQLVAVHSPGSIRLVNGLGSIRSTAVRQGLFARFKSLGYSFMQVIHPSAMVSPHAELAEGVQVMAGAVIQVGSRIGPNAIINTRASIDHDCTVGAHAHVAPGATLSGEVVVGEGAHIGTGATLIQGVRIGRNSCVGAGAVVIRDVPDRVTVVGVPAKEVQQ